MQARGYIGYGVYLNAKERQTLAKSIVDEIPQFFPNLSEVLDASDSFEFYLEQKFPELGVYILDGYNYGVQFQDDNAVLAVYMSERMNSVGDETVDFSAPSKKSQDELHALLKKIGSKKQITLIHWTAVEDN